MQIDKDMVLDLLRERGQTEQADRAEQELPSTVDTERDSGTLERLGLDPGELVGKLTGGRDIPGF